MSNINKVAKSLKKSIQTDKRTKPYDTQAEVVRIDGNTAWVQIPGGVDETPVKLTMNAKTGDTVQVRVSGGRAWLTGNATAPPTDDTRAIKADATAVSAKRAADSAVTEAYRAKDAADRAEVSAQQANAAATAAQRSAEQADQQAVYATNSANSALTQLSTVENVVDTLTWIEDNAAFEASTDTSVVAGKTYYVPSNQLLTLTDSTTTTYGLTIVVKDGIVTVNGTATGNVYLELGTPSATAGSTIYISGVSGGSWGNYGLRYAQAGGAVFVYDGVTKTTAVNNAKLYVYVGSGYAATDLRMYPLVSNTNDGLQYSVVESPSGNPSTNGYYELNIDDAVKTYVQSHLALTDAGLYVLNDASAYKMLLANDGMYIQAPNGTTVNQSTANGNVIKASNGTVIANLGYGEGSTPTSSSETDAPYYTFGTRKTTAQEYNTSTTYAVGDLCVYNGKQYVCVSATTGSWNSIKWRLTLGNWSVVEGRENISASGGHTEGYNNLDIGSNNHIEGSNNKAIGTGTTGDYAYNAHVGGQYCVVTGDGEGESNACFAHGIGVRSGGPAAFSIGRYNANGYQLLTVGNGTSDSARSNALQLDGDGDLRIKGDIYIGCNANSTGGTKILNGGVTGVKGNSESTYRTGDVNITAANVGALPNPSAGSVSEMGQYIDFHATGGATDYDVRLAANAATSTGGGFLHINGQPMKDFVTEQGTSSSWYYRKWKSGKIEAWRSYNAGSQTPSQWVTGWYYKDFDIAIPSGVFSSAPTNVQATNSGSDYQFMVFSAVPTSATNIRVRVVKPNSGAATPVISVYATNM